jgi:hypothetical protein
MPELLDAHFLLINRFRVQVPAGAPEQFDDSSLWVPTVGASTNSTRISAVRQNLIYSKLGAIRATTIIAALANGSSTPLATPDWMIVRI